jgi:hypothetical protein
MEAGENLDGRWEGLRGRRADDRSSELRKSRFSITKTPHLTERVTMELRCDLFNTLNHPNLSNPLLPGFGVDVFGSSHVAGTRLVAGADPIANGPQFMATTATPDVGSGNPYLGGAGPRSAQLAVHFRF